MSSSLKDFQDSFQRGILERDDTILGEVLDSATESRRVLFGVYRNAYVARLAEILGHDYEQTHAYLGDEGFAKLVSAYIGANPSDRRSARWFGRHLPTFAANTAPFSNHPEVSEIAGLEKALSDAFDGPNAEPLSLDQLASVPVEDWPRLTFRPHPTAIRHVFMTNAAAIWSALKEDTAPPKPARAPEPQAMLIWRQDFMARFRPVDAEESMMWTEAAKGVRFSVLCEMVAMFGGEDEAELRAATYLRGWIDVGLLAGYTLEQR